MKKRVADIVMESLLEFGVTDCFCVVGGGAMQLNNALAKCSEIRKYYNHHEQACAMAAEGYVKACGRLPAVCVTSGPGGTNTLTGVLCAWQDSVPMLILSGQVRTDISVKASGLNLRQRGEQEFDIVPMVSHMTKYAKTLTNPLEVKRELKKAVDIASSGRRGPVWIDIPLDVQGALVEEETLLEILPNPVQLPEASDDDLRCLMERLETAQRPCILVGSGVRASNVTEQFRSFAETLQLPVVAGIHVADAFYTEHPLYYGMSGTLGPRAGNFILQNADVIVTIGNSLHLCQTGFNQEAFAPHAKIIMVDIDENEARKPGLRIEKFIHTDLGLFFEKMKKFAAKINVNERWTAYCNRIKERFPLVEVPADLKPDQAVRQNYFWKIFERKVPKDAVIAYGNSMGVAGVVQKGTQYPKQRIIANFWVGTMGNDLPEAFGIAAATGKEVFCTTGDGSIMMNLQELQTIQYYHMPVKIILFSNGGYGTIRQTCKNFFNGVLVGCDADSGLGMPEFEKVARAFGYAYKKCAANQDIEDCLDWIMAEQGAAFLEVIQDADDSYEPKLKSRLLEDNTFATPALHDMYPFISEDELRRYMFE